jgi:hypothetical protein
MCIVGRRVFYSLGFAIATQAHTRLWARCISRGFTSPQLCQLPTPWFIAVRLPVFCSPKIRVVALAPDHMITWPLSTWGLDLLGPIKKAKGGFTCIFIAVNKFTKWIKVKPAVFITATKAVEFIREIMYQFSIPNNIITNNGTKFTAREFRDFCGDTGIKINYASVLHLQSNGPMV